MIPNPSGATWKSSHVYGQGQRNTLHKLAYYHIPKCASMWMRLCLAWHGRGCPQDRWESTSFVHEQLDDYRKIIILRDPVERWISNCPASEQIVTIAQDTNQTRDLFERIAEWQYDEHAAPQFDFVNGLALSNVVWFNCDNDLSTNVEVFFHSQGFANYQVPEIVNKQSQDTSTVKAAATWRRLLQIPKYLEMFKVAYKKDYDLIASVTFYRHS